MNKDGIDESLYSRQLYVYGKDAMVTISAKSVIISGLTGVGLEVAKNLILAGVKQVTLHDTVNLSQKDLASNYYANSENIGQNRAKVVHRNLSSLNPYVNVVTDTEDLCEDHFKKHNVIVLCDDIITNQFYYNTLARKYDVKFIVANSFGLMGYVFCDFGNEFIVKDVDGELPKSGVLVSTNEQGYCSNDPHELSVGDVINITLGNEEVVDAVTHVKDITTFKTKLFTGISNILINTSFKQIKQPHTINFKPLMDSIKLPEFATIISSDFDKQIVLHIWNIAVNMFINHYKRFPNSWDDDDATIMIKLYQSNACSYDTSLAVFDESRDQLIKKLSYTCAGRFAPIDSIIGSIACQDVIKALSGKFTPIQQWFYYDATDLVSQMDKLDESELLCGEKDSRYSAQINIFGNTVNKKIQYSKIFIVGAGAIGCEYLKNYISIGIKNIIITDMDRIEKSNLNRQFLFRTHNIGQFKSEAARDAIRQMNPDVNVTAHINKVAPETLSVYSPEFFQDLTCVTTGLDNINARTFVDNLCVINKKPLIDSGTLSVKCNVQCVIPFMTENYGASTDPQEKSIAVCTIKSFAYQIDHTIQFARDTFEGLFTKAPQNFMRYKNNSDEVKNLPPSELVEIYNDIMLIHNNNACHANDCILFAYKLWHQLFRDQIHHLVTTYPQDHKDDNGIPFWSGTKRFPQYSEFVLNDVNCAFIEYTANLWGSLFGLKNVSRNEIKKFLNKKTPPAIKTDKIGDENDDLASKLPNISEMTYNVKSLEFEKDDDTNFHIDFVTSVSNLRATNYHIPVVDKLETKRIAGKIIAALATTTSFVASMVAIELIKVIQGYNKIEQYNNSFANLGISMYAFSEPIQTKTTTIGSYKFSIWDNLSIDANPTLKTAIEFVKNKINKGIDINKQIDILEVSIDQHKLFASYFNTKQKTDRLNQTVKALYQKVADVDDNNIGTEITLTVFFDSDESDLDPITVKVIF